MKERDSLMTERSSDCSPLEWKAEYESMSGLISILKNELSSIFGTDKQADLEMTNASIRISKAARVYLTEESKKLAACRMLNRRVPNLEEHPQFDTPEKGIERAIQREIEEIMSHKDEIKAWHVNYLRVREIADRLREKIFEDLDLDQDKEMEMINKIMSRVAEIENGFDKRRAENFVAYHLLVGSSVGFSEIPNIDTPNGAFERAIREELAELEKRQEE